MRSRGKAGSAAGPMSPSVLIVAIQSGPRLVIVFSSIFSTMIKEGTASLAAGPKFPSALAVSRRTKMSSSFKATTSTGTTISVSLTRSRRAWTACSRCTESADLSCSAQWEVGLPQPAALARMLAERGRKIDEAVTLAEQAARVRHDIFTMDALAWAYFQAGRIPDARAASLEALRTGSLDRRIRCHAKAIEQGMNADTRCRFETWITDANAS